MGDIMPILYKGKWYDLGPREKYLEQAIELQNQINNYNSELSKVESQLALNKEVLAKAEKYHWPSLESWRNIVKIRQDRVNWLKNEIRKLNAQIKELEAKAFGKPTKLLKIDTPNTVHIGDTVYFKVLIDSQTSTPVTLKITSYMNGNPYTPSVDWTVNVKPGQNWYTSQPTTTHQGIGIAPKTTGTLKVCATLDKTVCDTTTVLQKPAPTPKIEAIDAYLKCVEYKLNDTYHTCSDILKNGSTLNYDWIHARLYIKLRNTGGKGRKSFKLTAHNCDFGKGVTSMTITAVVNANTTAVVEAADVFKTGSGTMTVCYEG